MMPRIARAFAGGDDRLITSIAKLAEEAGLRIIGVKDVAPEILVPEGARAVISLRRMTEPTSHARSI